MPPELVTPHGTRLFESYDRMEVGRIDRLERLAWTHGGSFDSYLITEPNRQYFWGRDDCGAIGFIRRGRYIQVAGGLIAAEHDKPALLKDLVEFANRNRLVISFFSIGASDVALFRRHGFRATKFGEEAVIPLGGRRWSGKKFNWIRRQVNYVERSGVAVEEIREADHDPAEWSAILVELFEIGKEHLSTKPQVDVIPFFEGKLIPGHILRRRLFIARADGGRGRVEAFILCTPFDDGDCWATELYRKRVDAVRGVIPFLMKNIIDILQHERRRALSLCPIPALRCERGIPGDCWPARMGLVFWEKCLGPLFDTKGMYHYKGRFRPEFEDVFVCAYPKSTVLAIFAFMQCIGAFRFKPWQVLKRIFGRNPQRRTLARSAMEQEQPTQPALKPQTHSASLFASSPVSKPRS